MNQGPDISHAFIKKTMDTIGSCGMIQKGDHVLVGISGGPDSIALTRVLMTLENHLGITLELAHLNHGLRGEESLRDEDFVKVFAEENSLELSIEARDIKALAQNEKLSIEEAGRNARYDLFNRLSAKSPKTKIALGHHEDDHVEQVLMNLIRGIGPQGLKGIPPKREGRIIRPLIRFTKLEILDFLKEISQPYILDSSNEDTLFLRNRIRHDLIPFIEDEFNPEIKTALARLSRIMRIEDDFLKEQTALAWDKAITASEKDRVTLSRDEFTALHPALAARVAREAILLVKEDLKRITQGHISDLLSFSRESEPGKSLDLPGQIRVYRKKEHLLIQKETLPLRELGRLRKRKN